VVNILHLIPTLEGGGAEKQLTILASEQCKNGYCVHIGLRRGGKNKSLLNDSVVIHYLGDYKSLDPRLFLSIFRLIRSIKPSILQTWLIQMDIVGGVLSLISPIQWIMTERTSEQGYVKWPILSWIRLQLSRYAKYIAVNSRSGYLYHKKNTFCKKVKVINNAIDIDYFTNIKTPSNANHFNGVTILTAGRLIPSKNYETLIRAVSLLPIDIDIKVKIFGNGPHRSTLQKMIELEKIENIIKIYPYDSDWVFLLKSADMFISMSLYEGSPNVVLEAMAAKCPLIVSDIAAHREILQEGSALFTPVNEFEILNLSIMNIINNQVQSKKMSSIAFEIVKGFNIQNAYREYDEIYKEVLTCVQ
jgi:glycosyltransferase involved in cell wall biosynthesis